MTAKADLRLELKRVLEKHAGPENAITAGDLARMFGYKDDRIIRLAIRELIRGDGDGNNGLPVASATENPPGYFIPVTRKQVEAYAGSIKSRLVEDALRRRDFRRAADQWLIRVQPPRQVGVQGTLL